MKTLIAAALTLVSITGAHAGNAVMTNAKTGQTVSVDCVNAGCTMRFSGGGKPDQTRTGPGGSNNFEKNVKSLRAQGYK
jgi:hypothetical protein